MADNEVKKQETDPKQADEQKKDLPPLLIHGQYIKDLSFEVPNAPVIFGDMMKEAPDVQVNVDVEAHKLAETQFEVCLKIRADCKLTEADKVAFIAELNYAGIFEINVAKEHLEPMLLIECPRMIFPFARGVLANASRDGSFPPLMLNPVDFAAMYRQKLEAAAAQKEAEGETKN